MPKLHKTIEMLCRPGNVHAVAQPVVRTADGVIVGYEALARIPVAPIRPPNWWLETAAGIGLRAELEVACLRAAAELGPPPDSSTLFVNLSPSMLTDPAALQLLDALPSRLVIELTEQEAVGDYDELQRSLHPWLSRGVRVAVDDTGAGYSSLRHVIELKPDFLKLDRELIRGIDDDRNRQALVRAVVAFASEVGTSVIAEGVETNAEFDVLREAQVHLVQGYLLARPAPDWPDVTGRWATNDQQTEGGGIDGLEPLRRALALVFDQKGACSAVVEHLFRRGEIMPSIYLESEGHLRCVAQRGLWQVLDGMPATAGITGRTWKEGRPILVERVRDDPDYLEAIPGVVAEICVPIAAGSRTIGALNVESLSPFPPRMFDTLIECARLLGKRLQLVRERTHETSWQRAARASIAISGIPSGVGFTERLLSCLRVASGMDSASLVMNGGDGPRTRAAVGPLGGDLQHLSAEDLDALSSLVGDIRSCYTAGDAMGRGFVGTDALRLAGARAVAVLPLWTRRRRIGSIILGNSRPIGLSGDEIEPLEMLADTVAALLADTQWGGPSELVGLSTRGAATA
jgi:EAL domain-containing protein (putative c-di-GMP-specific phosphodiesterase class I)/putative methionine-R-sulfoxide reductase with GAF domain